MRAGYCPIHLGLVLSLAAMARTDHLFYLPIGGAILVWQVWGDEPPGKLSRLLAFALPVGVIVGGYLALNLITTGYFMPVSGLVKRFWSESRTADQAWLALIHLDVRQSWKIGACVALALVVCDAYRRRVSGLGAYSAGALALFTLLGQRHIPHG